MHRRPPSLHYSDRQLYLCRPGLLKVIHLPISDVDLSAMTAVQQLACTVNLMKIRKVADTHGRPQHHTPSVSMSLSRLCFALFSFPRESPWSPNGDWRSLGSHGPGRYVRRCQADLPGRLSERLFAPTRCDELPAFHGRYVAMVSLAAQNEASRKRQVLIACCGAHRSKCSILRYAQLLLLGPLYRYRPSLVDPVAERSTLAPKSTSEVGAAGM